MKPSVVLIALLLGTVMASVHPDPLDGILGDSKPALKAYIFNLNSELNKTKRELQIAQKQNLLLNDALVASNTRAENLAKQNEVLSRNLGEVEMILFSSETRVSLLEKQVGQQSDRVSELAVSITELDMQIEKETQLRLQVEAQQNNLETQLANVSMEAATFLARLATEEARTADLETQLQTPRAHTLELAVKVTNLEAKVSQLKRKNNENEETILDLQRQLGEQTQLSLKKDIEFENLELQLVEQGVHHLDELSTYKTLVTNLELHLQNRGLRTAQLAIKVSDLEALVSTRRAEVTSLTSQLQHEKGLRQKAEVVSEEAVQELRIVQVQTESLLNQLNNIAPCLDELKQEASSLALEFEALLTQGSSSSASTNAESIFTRLMDIQLEVAKKEGFEEVYIVQEGDTLSIIASNYYNNLNRWIDIFEANAYLISNQDSIFSGLVLIMPP